MITLSELATCRTAIRSSFAKLKYFAGYSVGPLFSTDANIANEVCQTCRLGCPSSLTNDVVLSCHKLMDFNLSCSMISRLLKQRCS